jgi:hypothetical protein
MGLSLFDESYPLTFGNQIVPADALGSKAATSTESISRRIDAITVSNTDTIAHVMQLRQVIGGTTRLIGSATIPIGAGIGGAPTVDLLALCQPATQTNLLLLPGDSLTVVLEVALNAGKAIDLVTRGGFV